MKKFIHTCHIPITLMEDRLGIKARLLEEEEAAKAKAKAEGLDLTGVPNVTWVCTPAPEHINAVVTEDTGDNDGPVEVTMTWWGFEPFEVISMTEEGAFEHAVIYHYRSSLHPNHCMMCGPMPLGSSFAKHQWDIYNDLRGTKKT